MAYTTIAVQTLTDPVSSAGLMNTAPQNVAAGAGNGVKFANNGKTVLLVVNKGAAGSLTCLTGATVKGLAIADLAAITLPASGTNDGASIIGPFDPTLYNDSSGLCTVELTTGAGGADFWAVSLP